VLQYSFQELRCLSSDLVGFKLAKQWEAGASENEQNGSRNLKIGGGKSVAGNYFPKFQVIVGEVASSRN
jgi:hypothetical protein